MLETIPDQISFDEKNLYIRWKDGRDSSYELLHLRRMCPCAQCRGGHEKTARRTTGHIQEIQMRSFRKVGRYAISILWSDGHDLGIYTYDSLRQSSDRGIPYTPAGEAI
jgi:DUF971 family protein